MGNTSYKSLETPMYKGLEAWEVLAEHLINTS